MVYSFIQAFNILISLTIISINSKLVNILLHPTINTFNIKAMLGTSEEVYIFELNLYYDHTFASDSYFIPSSTTKVLSSGCESFGKCSSITYRLISDNLTLIGSDLQMNEFIFQYIDKFVYEYDTISLAYSTKNSNTNIVRKLYNDNVIHKMQFSIIAEQNYREDVHLCLGGLAENKPLKQYVTKIPIDKSFQGWDPQLRKVEIGGREYINHNKGFFQLSKHGIYAPRSFIMFIIEILKEDFDKKKCKMEYETIGLISCDCKVFDKIPNITFYFGNTNFTFGKDFLVIPGMNHCLFNIEKGNKNDDYWRFDYSFMKYFQMIFDYDDASITFYSDNPFIEKPSSNNIPHIIKHLCIILYITLIINSILLFINKLYIN